METETFGQAISGGVCQQMTPGGYGAIVTRDSTLHGGDADLYTIIFIGPDGPPSVMTGQRSREVKAMMHGLGYDPQGVGAWGGAVMASFCWNGVEITRAATVDEAMANARRAWTFLDLLPGDACPESDGNMVRCHTTNVYYRPEVTDEDNALTRAVLEAARTAGITDLQVECEHWHERDLLLEYRDTWIDGASQQDYGHGIYSRPTMNQGGLDDFQVRYRMDQGLYDEEDATDG